MAWEDVLKVDASYIREIMDINELKEFGRWYNVNEKTLIMNRIKELEAGGN